MKLAPALVIFCLSLTGCATYRDPVAPDYQGATATILDSNTVASTRKADLFYLLAVDGDEVDSALSKTIRANRGGGFTLSTVSTFTRIPIRPLTLTIVGRTHYAAPILVLTNPVYQVAGDIQFTPEPAKVYIVRGELGEGYSAVWLEERDTGQQIGKKIEIKGSAALGILQK